MDFKWSIFMVLSFSFVGNILADEDIIPDYDVPARKVRYFEYKTTNTLQCNITGVNPKSDNVSIKWLKNEETMEPSSDDPPRYVFQGNKLIIHKTREEDVANYTCLLLRNDKRLKRADITTEGIPTAKVHAQDTFIEGQKIRLECLIQGKPTPTIEWRYGHNTTFTSSVGRIKLLRNKNNVPNAVLEIDSALMTDRGTYTCSAANSASEFLNLTVEANTFVRVKAKLAALWPFIGICVEVIVLCAIIFIYERKRNKAELEESDTDQSPEQKNTPDHGKESVRQRK